MQILTGNRVLSLSDYHISQSYLQHAENVRLGKLMGSSAYAQGVDLVPHDSTKAYKECDITAHSNGTVIYANTLGGYGSFILIYHGDGLCTGYGHMKSLYVLAGQEVMAGNPIGLIGSSGNTTGIHLHWELRKYGVPLTVSQFAANPWQSFTWINPEPYINSHLPLTVINNNEQLKTGLEYAVSEAPVYNSEYGNAIGKRTGTYYIWSTDIINERIRMTNLPERCGVPDQVSFWISLKSLGYTASLGTPIIPAGAGCYLKNVIAYNSETGSSIGKRNGTYYVWSDAIKNGRIRMTNLPQRVGVAGQVSFWIAVSSIQ